MNLEDRFVELEARVARLEVKPVWMAGVWPWAKSLPRKVWANKSVALNVALVAFLAFGMAKPVDCDFNPFPTPTPRPDPIPPAPVDPLTKAFQAAWASEPATEKPGIAQLRGLYAKAATQAVKDPKVTTYKQLNDVVGSARNALIGDTLKSTRAVISDECTKVFSGGKTEIPVDATINRDLAAKTFTDIASAMEGLK